MSKHPITRWLDLSWRILATLVFLPVILWELKAMRRKA